MVFSGEKEAISVGSVLRRKGGGHVDCCSWLKAAYRRPAKKKKTLRDHRR